MSKQPSSRPRLSLTARGELETTPQRVPATERTIGLSRPLA